LLVFYSNFLPLWRPKKYKRMEVQANNKSRTMDWVLFLVSTAAVILLLMFADEWFWVALPFSLTYLVKALNAI
jgi:hypothetical protein